MSLKTGCLPEIGPATMMFSFPQGDPDSVLKGLGGDDRLFVRAELAVSRCDFKAAKALYGQLVTSPRYFQAAVRFGVISAIGLGDVGLFDEIVKRLVVLRRTVSDAAMELSVDLAEGWMHQWMWISTGYPEWIRRFDFENVPEQWRDSAAYLGARAYLVRGQFESAYAAAALMMNYAGPGRDITARDVYLMMTRAVACRETRREAEMKRWLEAVVCKVAPHGFLLPLLLFLHGSAKSPVEDLLGEIRPVLVPQFREINHSYYKNLVRIRNHYLSECVSDRLSLREMYLAMLLKRGLAYGELANRFGITVGRMKNLVSKVYEKLGIHSRGELKDIVW